MPLTLEIVTPDARVYAETIDSVVIPTAEGEVGILPGHIPLLSQVEHGELRVTKGAETLYLAVSGGFVEVGGDRVHVLAEHAITEEKVDEKATFYSTERRFGEFQRSVTLPFPVDSEKTTTKFENGLLEIRLPKAEESKARHIEIK